MKFFDFKNTALIVFIILSLSSSLLAWAPQVQSNYLKEAIRILPWFQYSMCKDYKNYLIEGIVEAEYQFWFIHSGECSGLAKNIQENKLKFIKGYNYEEEDIETVAEYFCEKFEGLKYRIRNGGHRYSQIMFELGYYLHSINNSLKPPYIHAENPTKEEIYYHSQCTRLAQNTAFLELRMEKINTITDLKSWLKNMLTKNLRTREEWYEELKTDKSGFEKYTRLVSERHIYNLASIINYVLSDLRPMKPEMEKSVIDKINKKFKGGRKPGI